MRKIRITESRLRRLIRNVLIEQGGADDAFGELTAATSAAEEPAEAPAPAPAPTPVPAATKKTAKAPAVAPASASKQKSPATKPGGPTPATAPKSAAKPAQKSIVSDKMMNVLSDKQMAAFGGDDEPEEMPTSAKTKTTVKSMSDTSTDFGSVDKPVSKSELPPGKPGQSAVVSVPGKLPTRVHWDSNVKKWIG